MANENAGMQLRLKLAQRGITRSRDHYSEDSGKHPGSCTGSDGRHERRRESTSAVRSVFR